MNRRSRRLGSLLALFLVPWTIFVGTGGIQLVFLWGLANPATLHVVGLPEYLLVLTSGLPDRLLAWPASTVLFLSGATAAVWDEFGRGEGRLTASLLGLSAIAHLGFVAGAASRGSATTLPLGPVLTGLVVWWLFWPVGWPRIGREE